MRVGGDRFDDAIVNYVRRNYGSLIGDSTAERIKHEIGCAYPSNEVRELEIKGRNLAEGLPRSFTLNSNEILEALQEPLQGIVSAVKQALEQTPPELGADVAERGIVLTGGGAILEGMPEIAEQIFDLPIRRGIPSGVGGLADHVSTPTYATAVGAVLYAHRNRPAIQSRGGVLWRQLQGLFKGFLGAS